MVSEEFAKIKQIWMDGKFMERDEAKTHVLSHSLHYGSGIFEGIRCYDTALGRHIFRLDDHVRRLYTSAKMLNMRIPFTPNEIKEAIKETIKINKLRSCYIRPIVFYGYYQLGLYSLDCPVNCAIAAWPWGSYLGEESRERGVRCTFTTWTKIHSSMLPVTAAKATGQYVNAMLAAADARAKGFDEAIMLDANGNVSEGPGENIFIVSNETIYTPSTSSSILPGITRNTIIKLARDMNYEVIEKDMTKEEVMSADEAFFSGTAAEVVPIREIDFREIGEIGTITKQIQDKYADVVYARDEKYRYWLDSID